jgi:hypothetical protein
MRTRRFVGWLWLVSGLPIGAALIWLPDAWRFWFFLAAVFLETGHSLSPVALAWTHRDFRKIILLSPRKYLLLPGAIFAATLAIGAATSAGLTSFVPGPYHSRVITDLTNPFPIIVWVYWLWNIFHFGMQNFGVLRLCRPMGHKGRFRRVEMIACLGLTAFGMAVLPMLVRSASLDFLLLGVFSFNHWLVDIGLSSRVSHSATGHGWLFIFGVLALGAVGFVWMVPTPTGLMIRVIPVIICARLGFGFVHFLYSCWIWKLGDPQVRAAIGEALA